MGNRKRINSSIMSTLMSISCCTAEISQIVFKNCLHDKYFGSVHEMNTIVFNIISAIKRIKLHISSTIIIYVSSFVYVIYSSAGLYLC